MTFFISCIPEMIIKYGNPITTDWLKQCREYESCPKWLAQNLDQTLSNIRISKRRNFSINGQINHFGNYSEIFDKEREKTPPKGTWLSDKEEGSHARFCFFSPWVLHKERAHMIHCSQLQGSFHQEIDMALVWLGRVNKWLLGWWIIIVRCKHI